MYFFNRITSIANELHEATQSWSAAKKLVLSAILAALAAVLQSAGSLVPVVGLLISPFATLPIMISAIISLSYGFFAYLIGTFLLILLEPSELFVFPFTTALLGLSLGWTLRTFQHRLFLFVANGFVLFLGICIPLYVVGFPIFGPMTSSEFKLSVLLAIFSFSVLYSWLWVELGQLIIKRIAVLFR